MVNEHAMPLPELAALGPLPETRSPAGAWLRELRHGQRNIAGSPAGLVVKRR